MPDGSWKCEKCSNINYPFRTKCNRQNCGADKPSESTKSPSASPDENDQVCHVMHFLCMCIYCFKKLLFPSFICTHITNLINTQFYSLFLIKFAMASFFIICLFTWIHLSMVMFTSCFFHICIAFLHLHPLICNCLLFQWVLGHVWGVEKVQGCRPALLNMGCLKVSHVVSMLQRLS